MNDNDPQKARLLARFKPMATTTIKQGLPPEKVDVATGKRTGNGPVGFSASLLPFLQNRDAQAVQRQHVADRFPDNNAYYSYVLTLFGQGRDQHRFRFTVQGIAWSGANAPGPGRQLPAAETAAGTGPSGGIHPA